MRIPSLLPLALAPLALATHLRISIPSSTHLPNPEVLPPSTSASLTTINHVLSAPLRVDNTFDFKNMTSGSYLLDVHCHTHAFAPLRVDVHEGGEDKKVEEVTVWGTFRGNEWGNKGEAVSVAEVEVEGKGKEKIWGFGVKALGSKEYLVERVGCEWPLLTTAAH
jgi:hypothetical protein